MTINLPTIASVKPPQPPKLPGNYFYVLQQSIVEFQQEYEHNHMFQMIGYYYRGDMATGDTVMRFAAANNLPVDTPIGGWPRDKRYCQELIEILTRQKIFPAAILVQIQQPVNTIQDMESNAADIGVNYFYQLPEKPLSLFRTVNGVARYAADCVTFHDVYGKPVESVKKISGHEYRTHGYRYDSLGGIAGEISVQHGFNVWEMHARLVGNLGR
jgi:hypothetical protein